MSAVTGRIRFSDNGVTEVLGLMSELKCRIKFNELDWSQCEGYV